MLKRYAVLIMSSMKVKSCKYGEIQMMSKDKLAKLYRDDSFVISYPKSREDWRDMPAHFIDDELEIGGLPVMASFEEPYMKELAKIATSNGGIILEVGFGMGISARFIQEYDIEEHVIIEANSDIFKRLELFVATAKHHVIPIFGFWQDVIDILPVNRFDGILFDPFALSESEWQNWHIDFVQHGYKLLKKGGVYTQYSNFSEITPEYQQFFREIGFSEINGNVIEVNFPEHSPVGKAQKTPFLFALKLIK
jgi:guanidinoacetate N-methyltransferase